MFGSLKNLALLAVSLGAVTTASAQTPGNYLRAPSKVQCTPLECRYRPVNKPAHILVNDMKRVAYGDVGGSLGGYVQTLDGGGVIAFKDSTPAILDILKQAAVEYDGMAEFVPKARIAITIEVYSVENSFLDKLAASVSAGAGIVEPVTADRATVSIGGGQSSIAATLGNLSTSFLKIQLDATRQRGVRSMKNYFSLMIEDYGQLSYTKQQVLYRDSASGVGNSTEKVGMSVSGTVNINGLDTNMVHISEFNITYGIPATDERSLVKEVRTNVGSIDIKRGTSYMIASDELEIDQALKRTTFGIFPGREKNKSNSKLLMVITAIPIPPMAM